MNNKISYVIPAYNCENTIGQTIVSIFGGNFKIGDEVIVVNDKSTDQTLSILKALKKSFPQIKIVSNKEQLGCPASRNVGISVARNDLIFNLDSDNIIVPGSMDRLSRYVIENDFDIGSFSDTRFFKNDMATPTRVWKIESSTLSLEDCFSGTINPASTGNVLIKKTLWNKSKYPLDKSLVILESWVFLVNHLSQGVKFGILPNSFYLHRHGHESLYHRESKKYDINKSATKAIKKILNRFEDDSREKVNKNKNWFLDLNKNPLTLKNCDVGKNGKVIYPTRNHLYWKSFLFFSIKKILSNVYKNKSLIGIEQLKFDFKLFNSVHFFKSHSFWLSKYRFDIDDESVVVDVGGYVGDWCGEIAAQYNSKIYSFEPIPYFYQKIVDRFSHNKRIRCYNVALGNRDCIKSISLLNDASSTQKSSDNQIKILNKNASRYFDKLHLKRINLIKMNIEGDEYDLLNNLIDTKWINKIDNLLIQFHKVDQTSEKKRQEIQDKLRETHFLTFEYPFVWEAWKLK